MSTARSTARPTSSTPTSSAPSRCWRRRAPTGSGWTRRRRAAFRFHHVSTDEVFGALGAGRSAVHRDHALRPAQPLFGQQGGLRPSGARLAPHLRPADHRQQHDQQLRAVAIPGEADPAGHPERAGRQARCRSTATARTCATGCSWTITRRRWCGCWSAASPAPPTPSARASRAATWRWCEAICAVLDAPQPDPAGPRERLIRFVTDRPGHDFRYEIDPSRAEAALGWQAPHDFERGLRGPSTGIWRTAPGGRPIRAAALRRRSGSARPRPSDKD